MDDKPDQATVGIMKRRRSRNLVVMALLVGLCVIIYMVTVLKLQGN